MSLIKRLKNMFIVESMEDTHDSDSGREFLIDGSEHLFDQDSGPARSESGLLQQPELSSTLRDDLAAFFESAWTSALGPTSDKVSLRHDLCTVRLVLHEIGFYLADAHRAMEQLKIQDKPHTWSNLFLFLFKLKALYTWERRQIRCEGGHAEGPSWDVSPLLPEVKAEGLAWKLRSGRHWVIDPEWTRDLHERAKTMNFELMFARDYLFLWEYREVALKYTVYEAVGKTLPVELVDIIFEYVMKGRKIPHTPRFPSEETTKLFVEHRGSDEPVIAPT
ncbi:hypothetical protein NA57DRAFT_81099 [Rhizodiscina lignyota]|uniref:Uncharacterized protein n=1 Tax=Rhizodiscina lignyota TaxID=1504668 RepID=A0A9P4M3T2_9PEZI|nr:hypothetical protein NA57DRAFT_81099 [Rhizodiscina lignyota]